MSDRESKLREELEEEARKWIKEEFERRFRIARETMEKQGRETVEYLRKTGVDDMGRIASETQLSISYAKSELLKDVRFEAENWVEKELKERLKKEK